ncbi:MAG: NAD(P)/FAD-dependent oxidoreductase [Candidatus Vogelbacteria bacterium]|nr:NAD(P)/FAD-dependent oxidoreductase [Candidatus Vogelbacteria bacterium]
MKENNNQHIAIIIGAGPAGLTAAYELLKRTKIKPIILEKSTYMGGISRTVNYKGNRIDIGGHRFFSKSDRVMNWWFNILPPEQMSAEDQRLAYQGKERMLLVTKSGPDPRKDDKVMLVRQRKSRIYFLRKFFDYPVSLSPNTLMGLGPVRTIKIGVSYIWSILFPINPETNLEEFFVNRFGRELYLTFFKSYTEKVWGIDCDKISAEWGAQRIKGLSITKTIIHMIKTVLPKSKTLSQKETETSLIEKFLYPKFGPGQMWEEVAKQVVAMGGEIIKDTDVIKVNASDDFKILSVETKNEVSKQNKTFEGDYFFSTMPMKELLRDMGETVPKNILEISDGLIYRDFITVGLLLKELKIKEGSKNGDKLIKDNWIYIQEPDVLLGRLQIFNNWSPYLVADQKNVWIGLEYFCYETDRIWNLPEKEMTAFAISELEKIGIIEKSNVLDSTVIKMPKTYPAYFGTYDHFDDLKNYISKFKNLFLVGRNGMHKYNNQDHSMLTAMVAVDNIIAGVEDKENIWSVNTEQDYHEKK